MSRDGDKRRAAEAALAEVRDGMLVGLGTGSTVAFLLDALAARVRDGLRIEAVATSIATERAAAAGGIRVRDFASVAAVDLAIDGVDEIDAACRAIKGAGGAMLREKVVAASARRMVAIADGSKRVERLGAAGVPVPVEVLPFAGAFVEARLRALGSEPALRMTDGAPYLTDNGHCVVDARFREIHDPEALAAAIDAVPGALGHGLFPREIDAAYITDGGIVTHLERGGRSG